MTSPLTTARQTLAAALTANGIRATAEVPGTFTPPLCWVAPRDPYRAAGQTFARKRVALAVVVLAGEGMNDANMELLDELATEVANLVDAMEGYRLDQNEVDAPTLFPGAQGRQFLGAVVNVWTEVARGG